MCHDGRRRPIVGVLEGHRSLSLPGILSAGIFAFTLSWNEYLYALTFISSSAKKTVSVGLVTELVRGDVYHWGPLMAFPFWELCFAP